MRSRFELHMNGPEVLAFKLLRVPKMVSDVLSGAGWTIADLEAFVPLQANCFILEHPRKRLKLPAEKMAISLSEFGSTSCASIPLTLSQVLPERLKREPVRMLLAGLGVGWSRGAAPVTLGPMVMPEIRHIGAKA